jgi:hypothetical protein
MASYLQTLAVGKYKKITAEGPGGIPLTYWYRPGTDDKLLPSLKKSPQFLTLPGASASGRTRSPPAASCWSTPRRAWRPSR